MCVCRRRGGLIDSSCPCPRFLPIESEVRSVIQSLYISREIYSPSQPNKHQARPRSLLHRHQVTLQTQKNSSEPSNSIIMQSELNIQAVIGFTGTSSSSFNQSSSSPLFSQTEIHLSYESISFDLHTLKKTIHTPHHFFTRIYTQLTPSLLSSCHRKGPRRPIVAPRQRAFDLPTRVDNRRASHHLAFANIPAWTRQLNLSDHRFEDRQVRCVRLENLHGVPSRYHHLGFRNSLAYASS